MRNGSRLSIYILKFDTRVKNILGVLDDGTLSPGRNSISDLFMKIILPGSPEDFQSFIPQRRTMNTKTSLSMSALWKNESG